MKLRDLTTKLALALSSLALAFAMTSFQVPAACEEDNAQQFANLLLDRVKACIGNDTALSQRNEMLALVDVLKSKGFYREAGSDDFRVKFVSTQGAVEHVLACAQAMGEIVQLVGVIHTPTPATPLCTLPTEAPSTGLLDPSIAYDLHKLLTVRSRAQIVREYLHKGGKLYIAYPRGGLERRTSEQQTTYHAALTEFPTLLIDSVLDSDLLPSDRVGAIYMFRDRQGHSYAFSIKSTQAIEPQAYVEWGLWFGAITNSAVSERVNNVFDYLDSLNGPDVRTEFGLSRG